MWDTDYTLLKIYFIILVFSFKVISSYFIKNIIVYREMYNFTLWCHDVIAKWNSEKHRNFSKSLSLSNLCRLSLVKTNVAKPLDFPLGPFVSIYITTYFQELS